MARETIMIDQQTSMRVDRVNDGERILTWPTNLTAKDIVRKLLGILSRRQDTAAWATEVVATTAEDDWGFESTEHYLTREEKFGVEQGHVVRFNAGPEPGQGFSVTVFREDGVTWLQANFGHEDELARQAVEDTIVAEGRGHADELLAAAP